MIVLCLFHMLFTLSFNPFMLFLQHSKKNCHSTKKSCANMPPGGVKSRTNKRVLAEQHPQHDQVSRATRSKKNYAAQVLGQRDLGDDNLVICMNHSFWLCCLH